jgi:hypothetical protein
MALFPTISGIELTQEDKDLQAFIEMSYSSTQSQTQGLWSEWMMDNRYEAGDTSA